MSSARDRLNARVSKKSQEALVGQKCDLYHDPDSLLGSRKRPKGWDSLSQGAKLDYIATRILAEDRRGITSHNALRESGILSVSQYERRLAREVYSNYRDGGDLDDQDAAIQRTARKKSASKGEVGQGTFGRAYPVKGRGKKRKVDYG